MERVISCILAERAGRIRLEIQTALSEAGKTAVLSDRENESGLLIVLITLYRSQSHKHKTILSVSLEHSNDAIVSFRVLEQLFSITGGA